MPDGVERSPQMADRLLVGAAAQGLARCALMVRDRAQARCHARNDAGDLQRGGLQIRGG
jgi:hypothetical protein